MSVTPFVVIGYAVSYASIESFKSTHGLQGLGHNPVLNHLQSLLRMPIYLASMPHDEDINHIIGFFASNSDPYYDCDEMRNIPIPHAFTEIIPTSFQTIGGIKRLFVPNGMLYTCGFDEGSEDFMDSITPSPKETAVLSKGKAFINQETCPPPPAFLHQMPVEIIRNIIDHLLLPSLPRHRQNCVFTFSHIDSKLRRIVLSSPSVWTSVFINHRKATWELANLCYDRSAPCTLHVEINTRRSTFSFPDIFGPLYRNASRLGTLAISRGTQGRIIVALSSLVAPNLQELILTADLGGSWSSSKLPHAPQLTHLKSQGLSLVSILPYPELKSLEFTSMGGRNEEDHLSIARIIKIVSACPKLETLIIGNNLHGAPFPEADQLANVHLPELKELSISDAPIPFIVFVLKKFNAPGLRRLALSCFGYNKGVPFTQWALDIPEFSQVETLRLDNAGISKMAQSVRNSFEGFLLAILDLLPNLKVLRVYECEILKLMRQAVKHTGSKGEQPRQLRQLARLEIIWEPRTGGVDDVKALCDFIKARKDHGYPQLGHLFIGSGGSAPRTLLINSLSNDVDRMEIL